MTRKDSYFRAVSLLLGNAAVLYVLLVIVSLGLILWWDPSWLDESRRRREAAASGLHFDTRTSLQLYQAILEGRGDALPPISPSQILGVRLAAPNQPPQLLPLSGISRARTALCNESGSYSWYTSDAFGFNNSPDSWLLPAGRSWVVIGDSYVHGACVDEGENVVSQINQLGISAINLGMGGSGPLIELAILREYAPRVSPKGIVWMYYEGNDLQNLDDEYRYEPLRAYLQPGHSQSLAARQPEIDAYWRDFLAQEYRRVISRSRWSERVGSALRLRPLRRLLRETLLRGSVLREDPPVERLFRPWLDSSSVLANFRQILAQADREARSLKSPLLFVYIPSYDKYNRRLPSYHDRIIGLVQELGIPVVDFDKTLSAEEDPLGNYPFRTRGHFNASGYAKLAREVVAGIRELEEAGR